jgi:DnaJ like chaperone protein
MTSTEIIVIVGGLLLGYWIVASLFNKKPVSSTNTNSNDDAKKGTHENRAHTEEPCNGNSCEEEHIPASWFRILEVSQGATKEQIITAYKQKIRQYHPDKVAQMGAEIRELAEFKSKQINAAYDYAMKLRG